MSLFNILQVPPTKNNETSFVQLLQRKLVTTYLRIIYKPLSRLPLGP